MKDEIKGVLFIGCLILLVIIVFNLLDNKIDLSNKFIIDYLSEQFDYTNINKDNKKALIPKVNVLSLLDKKNIFFNDEENLLNEYTSSKNSSTTKEVIKQESVMSNVSTIKDPIVYIYNTHNREQYSYDKNAPYNIIPTVMTTSYMLKEILSKNNINSIVEERDVSSILKKNKWSYASSYKVSRMFMEEAVKKKTSLNFFIDVHRDSVSYKTTTIEINKVKYARVLFISGLENKDYMKNLKMIEYINDEINKKYKGLSRGILKKKGKGVNGIYNQDFSSNCILIEIGGKDNTIDEVYNTTKIVGEVISKYIGDHNENK